MTGLLVFDFLLTRDNIKITKRYFLINLSTCLLLLFVKSYFLFFALMILSVFTFFVSYLLSLEEEQKKSVQEKIIDIPTVIVFLALVGIAVITVSQNIEFIVADRVIETTKDVFNWGVSFSQPYLAFPIVIVVITLLLFLKGRGKWN